MTYGFVLGLEQELNETIEYMQLQLKDHTVSSLGDTHAHTHTNNNNLIQCCIVKNQYTSTEANTESHLQNFDISTHISLEVCLSQAHCTHSEVLLIFNHHSVYSRNFPTTVIL